MMANGDSPGTPAPSPPQGEPPSAGGNSGGGSGDGAASAGGSGGGSGDDAASAGGSRGSASGHGAASAGGSGGSGSGGGSASAGESAGASGGGASSAGGGGGDDTGEDTASDGESADDDDGGDEEAAGGASGGDGGAGDSGVWLLFASPVDTDQRTFHLAEIEGVEHLSGLFHFRMVLRSENNTVDFSQILGKTGVVTAKRANGTSRFIHGVIGRFVQSGYDGIITTYYAELRPWLWQHTLTTDCRIFQNQSVPEIAAALFQEFGFSDFDDRTTGTHSAREYCVQYRETAFEFLSRLFEEEGIFYFFEHSDTAHTLILADDGDAHQPCPGLDAARIGALSWDRGEVEDLVTRCSFEQQMIPNQYQVTDYNFETPTTDLTSQADGSQTGQFSIFDYPGHYATTADGETVANRGIEPFEAPQKRLIGESTCKAFCAGYRFTLQNHERADLNTDYVLRMVSLWASPERYTNRFEAFPADVAFRPPAATPKPRIYGTQTGVVVGKSGEEIWTDAYGRVKVKFHWDRSGTTDENSSCWVRVAQVWAGKSWGTLFTPRIDTEVIISFLEGDPDQPIVIGTVYNARQTVPYTMPDNKTVSTILSRSSKSGSAGNEIKFDDTKDSEKFYFHAQKDLVVEVENDQSVTVTKNRTVTIKEEKDSLIVEKGDREINIQTGNETHTNQGDYTQKVTGDCTIEVQGNLTLKAGGTITIKGAMVKIN